MAIIGTGISGMAAAYSLRRKAQLTLFEKEQRSGGHTCTIEVDGPGAVQVDMGFIVFNAETYPGLCGLFQELGIETHACEMSFSMHNQEQGWIWSAARLFGARNLLRPGYWRMLGEALRFFRDAEKDVKLLDPEISLGQYFELRGYSEWLRDNFVYPMGAAIWSTPVQGIAEFPARSFLRFFQNHGLLGVDTQHQWYSVKGGSRTYHEAILKKIEQPVRLSEPVLAIESLPARTGAGARVRIKTARSEQDFGAVIVASHADEALTLLGPNASPLQQTLLSKFSYTTNNAVLHTDASVMHPDRKYWSAWNFKKDTATGAARNFRTATVYYMNALQALPEGQDYFVSINEFDSVAPEKVVARKTFEHPFFDKTAVAAQAHLPELNENGPIYFAGSYFKNGFHEDGYQAGTNAAKAVERAILSV